MANKNFTDTIRSKMYRTEKVEETKEEKNVPAVETHEDKNPVTEPFELPVAEIKTDDVKEKTSEELFKEAIEPYVGFSVIKSRKTNKITAIGLKKREDEGYIVSLIEKHSDALKDKSIDYAFLPKESLSIFFHDWEIKKMTVIPLEEGLSFAVKLDETVKKEKPLSEDASIDERLAAEGFVRDVDQLGECRKTSTFIPDDLLIYCSKRASSFKIFRGQQKWVICNLLARDRDSHPELR